MPTEPPRKRAVVFVDGQNLFNHAKAAFGYGFPNYDVYKLAEYVTQLRGWDLTGVRFYSGLPDPSDARNAFWAAKMAAMGRQGVWVFSRPLRYRNKTFRLPDGTQHSFQTAEEKGIDVRIALDVINLAHRREYDVAVIFSQDQDLSEVATEIRIIAQQQERWIKIACAFPSSPVSSSKRGINGTDWIKIARDIYEQCIDPTDYRKAIP
ncbi:MAG: NYN domain-containing protein [Terriglobales bacterium]